MASGRYASCWTAFFYNHLWLVRDVYVILWRSLVFSGDFRIFHEMPWLISMMQKAMTSQQNDLPTKWPPNRESDLPVMKRFCWRVCVIHVWSWSSVQKLWLWNGREQSGRNGLNTLMDSDMGTDSDSDPNSCSWQLGLESDSYSVHCENFCIVQSSH